jgi:Spy/CpxP family protein refolding chaperone
MQVAPGPLEERAGARGERAHQPFPRRTGMRTRNVLFVVALAALVVGAPARGQGPCYGSRSYAALDLTADQQKQISDLRAALDQKMAPLRNEMSTSRGELRQLWAAPAPDRKAIQEKQGRLDQIRKQMQDARTDYHLATLEILTPAQRERVQAAGGTAFGPGGGWGTCGAGAVGGRGGGRGGWCGGGCGGGYGCNGAGRGRGL